MNDDRQDRSGTVVLESEQELGTRIAAGIWTRLLAPVTVAAAAGTVRHSILKVNQELVKKYIEVLKVSNIGTFF